MPERGQPAAAGQAILTKYIVAHCNSHQLLVPVRVQEVRVLLRGEATVGDLPQLAGDDDG